MIESRFMATALSGTRTLRKTAIRRTKDRESTIVAEWDEDEATDDLVAGRVDAVEPPDDPGGDEDVPQTFYGSVDEFVREKLILSYRRLVGPQAPFRWAADWWSYPEAVSRLD